VYSRTAKQRASDIKLFGTAADKCSDVTCQERHQGELAKCQDYDAGDYINEQLCSGLTASSSIGRLQECNDKRKKRRNGAVNGGGWWLV